MKGKPICIWSENSRMPMASFQSTVHLCEFPGYSTIGTGGDNAQFWLNYRRQVLVINVKRSAYHAYEAKRMASKNPHSE